MIFLTEKKRSNLLLLLFLSMLFISCSGPKVLIEYQGSSPYTRAEADYVSENNSQGSLEKGQSEQYVVVMSIPSLEGGNRTLINRIVYPEDAIQQEVEGEVSVLFSIDSRGQASDFEIIKGIGHGCDQALIKAIKESEFKLDRAGTGNDNGTGPNFLWLVTAQFKL